MTSVTPSSTEVTNRKTTFTFDRIVALVLAGAFLVIGGRSLVTSLSLTRALRPLPASTMSRTKQILMKALDYYGVGLGPDSRRILTEYLRGNVNVNESFSGQTLLTIATINGYADIVEELLGRGANPNLRYLGWTPLYSACNRGNYQITQTLIEHGADVNESKGDGWTPFLTAASNSTNPDLIKLLIRAGANVNAIAPSGESPLDLALQRMDPEGKIIAEMIRAAGGRTHKYQTRR